MSRIHQAAAGVMAARALGLVSAFSLTVAIAHRYGSDRRTDLALAVLLVPTQLALIAGAILPPVLLSIRATVEARGGAGEGAAYARAALGWVLILSSACAILGALLAGPLSRALGASVVESDLLVRLLRPAFSIVVLSAAAAALKGFLNAGGRFFLPSLELFAANGVALAVLFIFPPEEVLQALVVGAVAGAGCRLLVSLPGSRSVLGGAGPGGTHPALRDTLFVLLPVLLNSGIHLVNISVARALAARLPEAGSFSCLSFAERLVSAPHDLFVTSLGSVLLATLSRRNAAEDLVGLRKQVTLGLRLSSWFGFPAALGLFLLAQPIVALVYQHGRFGKEDAELTVLALRSLTPTLAFCGITLLAQAFYALQSTWLILGVGTTMAVVNLGLGFAWVDAHGVGGLAAASSCSIGAGLLASGVLFVRRAGALEWGSLLRGAAGSAGACAVMALVVEPLRRTGSLHVLGLVAIGAFVYAGVSWFTCPGEWSLLRRYWTRGD